MMEGVPYCNKNGFVWGIKVPVGVKHAYEKVLFDNAYPEFRAWVTSNGADNKDWYLHPAAEKVVEAWPLFFRKEGFLCIRKNYL